MKGIVAAAALAAMGTSLAGDLEVVDISGETNRHVIVAARGRNQ